MEDDEGNTALDLAKKEGHTEIVSILKVKYPGIKEFFDGNSYRKS